MKKLYTLTLLLFAAFSAKATIHNVGVINNSFTPGSITDVVVGDTIRWTLGQGTHNTTSTTIPNGAATWAYQFSGFGDSFDYKVTVAGTYTYRCTFHGGMNGSFTATNGTTSINELDNTASLKAYPNPFKTKLNVPNKTADNIEILNVLGEKVKSVSVNENEKHTVLDLSDLKKGVYFYVLKQEGEILETRRVVKSE
ncbi:MAG: copper binding protein plastocyanin [Crocinitomicaceae bacterium]|jgi:plastocyanin|nr:copper binding protein plastocyanin [Crocinitomicaceae bacterium]